MTLKEELNRIKETSRVEANEANTTNSLVRPILEALGWNTTDTTQYRQEHRVDKRSGFVDISLAPPKSTREVFIEVKSQDKKIDHYLTQAKIYSFHGGVKIITLTNGIDWWFYLPFYDKGKEDISFEERRFATLNIKNDLIEDLIEEFNTYLSFNALNSYDKVLQSATKALDARRKINELTKKLPENWQKLLNNPPSELINLIKKDVNTSTGLIPTDDQVRCFLSAQTSKSTDLSQKIKINTVPRDKEKKSAIKAPKIPFMIEILGKQLSVNTYRQIWISVVEELYSLNSRKFRSIIGKPHSKKVYIEAGNAGFKKPYRIGKTKYWIELRGNADTLIKRSKYLLQLFGFNENDLTILDSSIVRKSQKIQKGTKKVQNSNQPVAYTLFGVKHPVKYLKDVWEGVANELYKKHTDNFSKVVGKPDGKRRSFVELSEKSMRQPRRIKNSKYWIKTHVTEKELESRCHYLLEQFGYSKTDLKIHF